MLTKHLYRLEEVRAAFLYTLKQGRLKESHFWLNELEDSMYGGEARRLLFLSWLMQIGLRNLTWLEAWACESETREGRWRLCWQLIRCKERDSSIWLLVWSVVVASDGQLVGRQDAGRLFSEWLVACKKQEEEFWQPLVDASEDERIDRILVALQTNMNKYDLFAKAAALTVVYESKRLKPSICWPSVSSIHEQNTPSVDSSIKDGRLYTIPNDCLFGMTLRGSGINTTEELHCLGEKEFTQSAYWRTKWPSEQTDEALELFWDTYFPWTTCDHPDEWSLVEQEKSHGVGTKGAGPLLRWWLNWIPKDHLFVWGFIHRRLESWIKTQQTTNNILDTLLGLYTKFQPPSNIPIYPIQKEFVLL
jgi:hypothetical protein